MSDAERDAHREDGRDDARGEAEPATPRRPRRSRRAVAPPTASPAPEASATPDADWGAWLAAGEDKAAPEQPRNERERWFLEERPPHW